MYHQSRIEA